MSERSTRKNDDVAPEQAMSPQNGHDPSSPNGAGKSPDDGGKTVYDVGRTMPARYLAIGQHTIPYALRVEQIARGGIPDVVVDSGEALAPGHFGEDSPLRPEIDDMLGAAAKLLSDQRRG